MNAINRPPVQLDPNETYDFSPITTFHGKKFKLTYKYEHNEEAFHFTCEGNAFFGMISKARAEKDKWIFKTFYTNPKAHANGN